MIPSLLSWNWYPQRGAKEAVRRRLANIASEGILRTAPIGRQIRWLASRAKMPEAVARLDRRCSVCKFAVGGSRGLPCLQQDARAD